MKGSERRVTQKEIRAWLKTPDGKARLLIMDMARGGVCCEGMDIKGRELLLTLKYDRKMHEAHIQNGDKVPDLKDAQYERCWIIGILCRIFKVRFTTNEKAFIHRVYFIILEPDGKAREVVQVLLSDAVKFAGKKIPAEQFAESWTMKTIPGPETEVRGSDARKGSPETYH